MKKNILGLFTVFCVLYLSMCFSPWEGDSGEGSLTVNLGGAARSAFYDADDEDVNSFSHEIYLRKADGTLVDNKQFSSSITISVPSGTYTVTVKGYGDNNTLRSYGTEPAEVVPGKNTPVSIKMYSAVKVDNQDGLNDAFDEAVIEKNSSRMLYVFMTETFPVNKTISFVSGNVTLIAENEAGITGNGIQGSMFSISGSAVLRIGVKGQSGTITLTGSDNNTAPLINVNGGTLEMDGVTISGNNNRGGNGGGVSVTNGGIFRIVTGTIYGSDEADTKLRNTTNSSGAALYGKVEYGTFSGEQWNGKDMDTTDNTIEVVNGYLIRGGNIPVTDVMLTPSELSLTLGGPHGILTATVTPDNATNQTVTWESDSPDVATVDNGGLVTAVTAGTATITVTTKEGGFMAICTVTVQLPALTGIVIITGSAAVGQTLTANITTLGGSGDIFYQWNRNETAISDAKSGDYIVQDADIGSTITVTVTRSGNSSSVTSAPTAAVSEKVNAQEPSITSQPVSATVAQDASHSLSVTAIVSDGGTLSYQWYSNTEMTNSGGTSLGDGARSVSYPPPTGTVGTYYFFVEVTNTITDNGDGGIKTATIRSNPVVLTIASGTFSIDFDLINDNTPIITVPTVVSRSGDNGPKTITLTVTGQYDAITWYVANVIVNGATLTLDAMNIANVGEHFLTLEVWKDVVPYSKTVVFTVVE